MARVRNGILNLKSNGTSEALEDILSMANDQGLESFIFAGFMPDGTTVMCTNGVDILEYQNLISVLQADANYRSIDERLVYEVISIEEIRRRKEISGYPYDDDEDEE